MKIVSVVVNNPIFIELQYNSIQKFFKSEEKPEIIIFNDAKDWPDNTNFNNIHVKPKIINTCKKLNIKCINIPNEQHKNITCPSTRHSQSLNFITSYMINNLDTYLILDSDMFFIDNFDINDFKKYYFCYVNQFRIINNTRINYPWANFFYLDSLNIPYKELIDWSPCNGLDTGGKNHVWLSKLDKDKIFEIEYLQSCTWNETNLPISINKNIKNFLENDLRNKNSKYFAEIFYNKIFHYRAGSNWMNDTYNLHNKLTQLLKETLSII
jgi:hypothetical protein